MPRTAFRAFLAFALLAQMLLALAATASPSLHEWLHADAGHDDHECSVTLFASGTCENPVTPALLSGFTGQEFAIVFHPPSDADVPSFYLTNRVLEHAPPIGA